MLEIEEDVFTRAVSTVDASGNQNSLVFNAVYCGKCREYALFEDVFGHFIAQTSTSAGSNQQDKFEEDDHLDPLGRGELPSIFDAKICIDYVRWECGISSHATGDPWTWKIVNPNIQIKSSGIRLYGTLVIVYKGVQSYFALDSPMSVTFNETYSKLKITPLGSSYPVNIIDDFSEKLLGYINFKPFFTVQKNLKSSFHSTGNQVVNARLTNLTSTSLENKLRIDANVSF